MTNEKYSAHGRLLLDSYTLSPTGGGKRRSPAGVQAQHSPEQGRHLLRVRRREGARYRLHPQLGEC